MGSELSNPLQALIAGVAQSTPAETGATASYRRRLDGAGPGVVILCDCSTSMAERAGGRTKHELLREALAGVLPDLPGAELVAFGSTAARIGGASGLPAPAGSTALHLALGVASASRPGRTLVISDGRPDSEAEALAAADRLPGLIDVIYCGPDSDAEAIAFMYRLARKGGGRVVVRDVVRSGRGALGPAVRQVLGLPSPE